MGDRLYRHPTDRVIGGVAGGLAAWLRIDPSLVRIAWVLLAIVSGGIFVLVYLVMLFVVPLPPPGWAPAPGAGPVRPGGPPPTTPPTTPPATPSWGPSWDAPPAGGSSVERRGASAGIVGGVVLVLLGAWFLVDDYVRIDWSIAWPVLLVAGGAVLVGTALARGRER